MGKIYFGEGSVSVAYDTSDLSFQLSYKGKEFCSDNRNPAHFITKDKKKVLFTEAGKIEHYEFKTGVGDGVRTKFSHFVSDGICYDIAFETYIWLENETGCLRFEFIPVKEEKFDLFSVAYPAPIILNKNENKNENENENGYSALPIMQGLLILDKDEQEIKPTLSKRMFSRESYMPWWGQVGDKEGYMAIVETPWDAEYEYYHAPKEQTSIHVSWIGSLGKIDYRRKLSLRFFEDCDYVTFCKEYRNYIKVASGFVTLEEKIIKNPKVAELIGNPIIHTDCIHWHCEPESDYYDSENLDNNYRVQTFDNIAKKIEHVKTLGVKKAYVHIDGWGKGGYDNLHPDIIPPSEPAGGIDGLRDMLKRIKDLDYIPALHDQYHDYYIKAESYSDNQSVLMANMELDKCSIWPGGNASMLCAQVAPYYVMRNYNYLERAGALPEGVYLDVFSVIEPDECVNELHRLTRKECIEKRCECFEIIRNKGMIVSSEEPLDKFVNHLDLVHHGPYAYALWESVNAQPYGIPVPLFNLVYHDSIIIPWGAVGVGGWGYPKEDECFFHALLNGGMPYLSMLPNEIELRRVGIASNLHSVVAKSEMISHSFIDDTFRRQQTVFSCNTKVLVDFITGDFSIAFADGSIIDGNVNDKSMLWEPIKQ